MDKTLLILGGYGNMGQQIAHLLLKETKCKLILAGPNLEKAEETAEKLNSGQEEKRVSPMNANAANVQSLSNAFINCDLVIVASSSIQYTENIVKATLEAGIDYYDCQFSSSKKLETIYSFHNEIVEKGCCFITEGGLQPGIPAMLVNYAARQMDEIEKANVGTVIRNDSRKLEFSDSTLAEMIDERINTIPIVYENNKWRKYSWKESRQFYFDKPFGNLYLEPSFLEEMRSLPQKYPTIKETGFFISELNWITENILSPFCLMGVSLLGSKTSGFFGKAFNWGKKNCTPDPFGTKVLLESYGWKEEKYINIQVELFQQSKYSLAAAAIVACLLQYLEGTLEETGVLFQGHCVDPERMLEDLGKLGVKVDINKYQ